MAHQTSQYAACGMDDVVAKPINVQSLYDALNRAVEQAAADAAHAPRAAGAA
jgi:FixJ family two-component response regulator